MWGAGAAAGLPWCNGPAATGVGMKQWQRKATHIMSGLEVMRCRMCVHVVAFSFTTRNAFIHEDMSLQRLRYSGTQGKGGITQHGGAQRLQS